MEVEKIIYQFLTEQYEQAKLQEAKDTPTIQILDRAVPPERKAKPKRSLIIALAGLIGLFIGIFIAFLKEYFYRLSLSDPHRYNQFISLYKKTRKDFFDRKEKSI
jgi:tyrosine-protein kinase Etk/Wzc